MKATFDVAAARDFTLKVIDFRIPKFNELYINKLGLCQRCKKKNYSRRAQRRIIIKEHWSAAEIYMTDYPLVATNMDGYVKGAQNVIQNR